MDTIFLPVQLVVTSFFIYIIYKIYEFIRYLKELEKIPGPPGSLLFGQVMYLSQRPDEMFVQLRKIAKKFPNGYKLRAGHIGAVVISTPEDVETVLSSIKYIEKSAIYLMLQPWMETGLITSTGQKWQQRRKILTPAFHFNILQRFLTVINEHCKDLMDDIATNLDKNKISVLPLISKHTLNTICETAMGTKLESTNTEQQNYRQAIYNLAPIIVERLVKPWLYFPFTYFFTKMYRDEKSYLKTMHRFTANVIQEREKTFKMSDVEHLETNDPEDDDTIFTKKKKRLAMLDLLLSFKTNGLIDSHGIREEVDTFMFAGHDTVSMAISFALMMIANHKEEQEKIIEELKEIFGDSDRMPDTEDLQNMKYLAMCIKESMRLYPSVPFISRLTHEDIKLSHFTAPAETMINLFIYDIHRNEQYFPKPEKFDPNRFLPENTIGRHPFVYVPFSAGPRNCIGQRFALMEMKCIISSILRKYRIEPITTREDITLICDVVLRCKNDIYIKLTPRT